MTINNLKEKVNNNYSETILQVELLLNLNNSLKSNKEICWEKISLINKETFLTKKDEIQIRIEEQIKKKEKSLQTKWSKDTLINHLHKLNKKEVELINTNRIQQSKYLNKELVLTPLQN